MQNHEDKGPSLIRALIDAIYFVITKKADTLTIIKKHCAELSKCRMTKSGVAITRPKLLCSNLSHIRRWMRSRMFLPLAHSSTMPNIQNFKPLVLWDLYYLREIDDSDYINQLYG